MSALKPYWGKPAVRNFRGGYGNGGIMRSPLSAIALLDYCGQYFPNVIWITLLPRAGSRVHKWHSRLCANCNLFVSRASYLVTSRGFLKKFHER